MEPAVVVEADKAALEGVHQGPSRLPPELYMVYNQTIKKSKLDPKVKNAMDVERGYKTVYVGGLKIYECMECQQQIEFNSLMRDHVNVSHKRVIMECTECEFKSYNSKTLNNHRRSNHNLMGMKCPLCNFKSIIRPSMVAHMKKKHPDAEIPEKFDAERKSFRGITLKGNEPPGDRRRKGLRTKRREHKGELSDHYTISHDPETEQRKYSCNHCDYTHIRYNRMSVHINSIHFKKEVKCTECSYSTYNMSTFYTHFRTSHKQKQVEKKHCIVPDCNFVSLRDEVLQMHLWKKHGAIYDEEEHAIKVFK